MVALVILPGMDGTGSLRDDFVAALGPPFDTTIVSYPADKALPYADLQMLARACVPADRPYVVLGESFSGPIAIAIAASRPPGLVGVILVCSFADNPRPMLGTARPLLRWLPLKRVPIAVSSALLLGRFATATLRAALKRALARLSSSTLRQRACAVLDVDVLQELSELRVPVLYLRASEDRIVPRSCSERIKCAAPQTRIIEIEAPHCLLQTAPSAAAAAVKDFLRTIQACPSP